LLSAVLPRLLPAHLIGHLPAFLLWDGGALGLWLIPAFLLRLVMTVLDGDVVAILNWVSLALPHWLVPTLLYGAAHLGRGMAG